MLFLKIYVTFVRREQKRMNKRENNMKRFLYLTVCLLILGEFYGCNGDVFVDDFRPSDSELALDGNGDVATIQFAAANWDWLAMYTVSSLPVQYKVYDADNRLVTNDQGPSLNGLGKIVCTGEMIDFTIERVHPEEVKITVGENALSAPFQFLLTASNEYEWQEIHVEISPGDRYVMDSIIYSLNAYSYDPENKIEKKEGVSFHNLTDVSSTYTFFPFESFYHFMRFKSDVPEAFQLLGEAGLTVEIPSMKDGYLVMNGKRAPFISEQQMLPCPSTEQNKDIIPPRTSRYYTLSMMYDWLETRYTLYVSHSKTKKQRIVTGTLHIYVSADNLITWNLDKKFKSYDVELGGVDGLLDGGGTVPLARTFTAGINLTF